jgi:hypothetical protein
MVFLHHRPVFLNFFVCDFTRIHCTTVITNRAKHGKTQQNTFTKRNTANMGPATTLPLAGTCDGRLHTQNVIVHSIAARNFANPSLAHGDASDARCKISTHWPLAKLEYRLMERDSIPKPFGAGEQQRASEDHPRAYPNLSRATHVPDCAGESNAQEHVIIAIEFVTADNIRGRASE